MRDLNLFINKYHQSLDPSISTFCNYILPLFLVFVWITTRDYTTFNQTWCKLFLSLPYFFGRRCNLKLFVPLILTREKQFWLSANWDVRGTCFCTNSTFAFQFGDAACSTGGQQAVSGELWQLQPQYLQCGLTLTRSKYGQFQPSSKHHILTTMSSDSDVSDLYCPD